MNIASGVAKQLRYKKESAWGTAPGATGAQLLRRTESNLDLAKETYQSAEIRSDRQVSDMRHGVRSVTGAINGELSPGTYKDFFAAALRNAWQTAATTGAKTDITAAAAAPQFVRGAGSFITDGFKVGDVVRWTGFAAPATANNTRNFLITALTATDMTGVFIDGSAVVAKAAGDSVTCTLAGKKTFAATTGHTDDSFAIEHWYSDIAQSELFTGCKVNTMAINLPPTGMATVAMDMMGKDVTPAQAEYFTAPSAETDSGVLVAVNGKLYVGAAAVQILTGLNFTINGNMAFPDACVGSDTYPFVNPGRITVDGQFTAYFEDETYRDMFVNETETSIVAVFTASNAPDADFLAFVLPRIKVGGAGKDDGEKGLVQTLPFTALLNTAGGPTAATEKTTISVQDSTVA